MELVTKLEFILMLIGIVGIAETTQDGIFSSTIAKEESSTQDTTMTEITMTTQDTTMTEITMTTQDTTMTEKTMTTQDTTMTEITMTTQDTTMTEATRTTPGKGQESKKCDDVFIFGGVAVALTIPITVIITILLIWRRIGSGPLIRCTRSGTGPRKEKLVGSDQVARFVPDRNGAEQSNTADEPDYDQPQWNRITLGDHRKPIGNEMENTEYENVGRSSYEGFHRYENHEMNLYDSCSQEHILQEETEEIGI